MDASSHLLLLLDIDVFLHQKSYVVIMTSAHHCPLELL